LNSIASDYLRNYQIKRQKNKVKNSGNMSGNFKVVMIVHFGTKLHFLLFCSPCFEREER
jgi:hypothetical protein